MGNFIKATAKDIDTRDVFVYKGKAGYVLALTGASMEGSQAHATYLTYSDGTGEYKELEIERDEPVEILKFDPEYYKWRKAMLKNTGLEHLTS